MVTFLIFCTFLLLFPLVSFPEVIPAEAVNQRQMQFIPKVMVLQYAGNMGLASVGFGYSCKRERYGLQLFYGYLPKRVSGIEVKTIAIKGLIESDKRHPFKGVTTSNYAGVNFHYARTHNTYTFFPDHYPKDYYPSNAVHFAPFVGGKMDFDLENSKYISKAGFFFEVGTLDTYLITYTKNSNVMQFRDIWNLSVGLSISLNRLATIQSIRERI